MIHQASRILWKTLFPLFMAVILFQSCQKDDFSTLGKPEWSPELAFPLAYSELEITDLMHVDGSGTVLVTDPNQFCTLVYRGTATSLNASMVTEIPDQRIIESISLTSSQILALNTLGSITIPGSMLLELNLAPGTRIDSSTFWNGELDVSLQTNLPADIHLQFEFPDVHLNNTKLNGTNEIIQPDNSSLTITSISGYDFDFTKAGPGGNKLLVDFNITINNLNGTIAPGQTITMIHDIKKLEYETLYGYFGQNSFINPRDTLSISIFNNSLSLGAFTIVDPKVEFKLNNSLGLPLEITLPELVALGNSNPNPVSGIPNPIPTQSPSLPELGQAKLTGFVLSNQNSNVSSIINQQPRYLFTQSRVVTNPNGTAQNFLTRTGNLSIDVAVEMPLYGTIQNFKIRDTLPFSYDDLKNVEYLELRTDVTNGFPLSSNIEVVFTDENYSPIDTLFSSNEIQVPGGTVDPVTERVTIPGKRSAANILTKQMLNDLMLAKHIIITGIATSTNDGNTNIKLFADYKLKVKIGAKAKIKVQ